MHKSAWILLLVVLFLQVTTLYALVTSYQRDVGDINNDGEINALDITALEIKIVEYYNGY